MRETTIISPVLNSYGEVPVAVRLEESDLDRLMALYALVVSGGCNNCDGAIQLYAHGLSRDLAENEKPYITCDGSSIHKVGIHENPAMHFHGACRPLRSASVRCQVRDKLIG
jgi:hypothetical protein